MTDTVSGDNQLPSPTEDLKNRLTDATATIAGRIRMLRVALEQVPAVITEDIEATVTDQLGQAKTALADLEKLRKASKKPLDDLVDVVQDHFRPIAELLSIPKGAEGGVLEKALLRLGAYQLAKRKKETADREAAQRRAQAEADRLREEAEAEEKRASELARAARTAADVEQAADAAQRAQEARAGVASAEKVAAAAARPVAAGHAVGTGAKAHLRTTTKFEVVDLDKVPRAFMTVDKTKVDQAIAAGMTAIPGLRIFEEASSTVVTR